MVVKFSALELRHFKDKDSKIDRFRELYESNDFLTAYAKHTDLRVADDPHGSIGRSDQWESHGNLQLAFLVKQGLRPEHMLLDVGCGVGRGARKFVPYLNDYHYVGADISPKALDCAIELSVTEGWAAKHPTFMLNSDLDIAYRTFDMIWAHSVFNHSPDEQVEKMIRNAAKIMKIGAQFWFTYKLAETSIRTGLKQFKRNPDMFEWIAKSCGLIGRTDPTMFPAKQRSYVLTK